MGRWIWRRIDRLLEGLPLLGTMYHSLKEILGYDSGRSRFFQGVVAVQCDEGDELGLITGETVGHDGQPRAMVFVPGSPNPANGRLLLLDPRTLRKMDVRVADALRGLVSMGKSPLKGEA
jgi:uncharacterized membrane protein